MTSPLDEKGLEAAREAVRLNPTDIETAIRTYLSATALPDGMDVVAWRREFDGWLNTQKHGQPLVRQSALTAMTAERDALSRDIASYVQANADLLARVQRLEKALGQIATGHDDDGLKVDFPAIIASEAIKEDENVRS